MLWMIIIHDMNAQAYEGRQAVDAVAGANHDNNADRFEHTHKATAFRTHPLGALRTSQ